MTSTASPYGAEPGGVVIAVGSEDAESEAGANAPQAGESKVALDRREEGSVVIDVKLGGRGMDGEGDSEMEEEEKVCRICHLSPESGGPERAELIQIGCGCKNELGSAHRHCAEAWFRVKGNRFCEICGLNAKNINGEDDSGFMSEWYDRTAVDSRSNRNSSERVSCWRGQPFCNCLMACLVIAFILPWFFRVNMF